MSTIAREALLKIATEALSDALAEKKKSLPADLSPETEIFGRGSLLDSLGLVTMVMELETRLDEEHGITVVLASEKAMSRRSSPFRTLGSLVDYIEAEMKKGDK